MGLISLLRDAGERLFHAPSAAPAAAPAAAARDVAALNATASQAIERSVGSQALQADGLDVRYDGATQTVRVSGVAPEQARKENIVPCCGNVSSIAKVNDLLTVASGGQPESKCHEVKSGETLSKIAKEAWGDANAYVRILEANQPTLSNPDTIHPGQKLRIPPERGRDARTTRSR